MKASRRLLFLLPLLLPLLAFLGPLFGGEALMYGDHGGVFRPRWHGIVQALEHGVVPARTLGNAGAVPMELTPNASFTPLSALILVGDGFSYDLMIWAHVALLSLGVFLLARRMRLSNHAALLSAAACVLGPVFSFENLLVGLVGLAYTPWVLWAFVGLLRRPSATGVGAFGLSSAMLLQAIMPETALVVVLGGALLLSLEWPACWRRSLLAFTAGAALAVGIAAIELFPVLEALRQSERGQGFPLYTRTAWSLAPARMLGFSAPSLFGLPELGLLRWPHTGAPRSYLVSIYLSFTPWIAALGLASRRAPRWLRGALAAVMGLGLIMALGEHTPVYGWVSELPVLRSARYPVKYLLVFCLGLAWLLPLGLVEAIRRPRRLLAALLLHAGLVAGVWMAVAAGGLDGLLSELLDRPGLKRLVGVDETAALGLIQQAQTVRLSYALTFGLLAAAVAWLLTRRTIKPRVAALSLVLVAWVDLAGGASFGVATLPEDRPQNPKLAALLQGKNYFAFGVSGRASPMRVQPSPQLMRRRAEDARQRLPAWGVARDRADSNADGMTPKGMILAYAGLQHTDGDARWMLLRRMGVEYLGTWLKTGLPRVLTVPVRGGPPEFIYQLPRPRSHVTAYTCWSKVSRDDTNGNILELLSNPVGENIAVTFREPGEHGPIRIFCDHPPTATAVDHSTRHSGDQVDLRFTSARPYLAVLLEERHAGWHAYIDGQPAETVEAEAGFVGVFVPAGDHQVRFVYEPLLTKWIPVTLTSLAITLALLILGLWNDRRRRQQQHDPA